jgi:hypothetical protein
LIHKYDCLDDVIQDYQIALGGSGVSPTFYGDNISLNDSLVMLDGVIPPLTVYRFTPALITTSQEEISSITTFAVVPNPVQDELRFVHDENDGFIIRRASIIDVNGKVLLSELEFNKESSISNLQSGMYFVRVELESGETYSEKFTKL